MRILHILTFLSDSRRSFGGPATVALDLAKGQTQHGHRVTVISLGQSLDDPSFETIAFSPVTVNSRWGFAGMFSPPLLAWLTTHMSRYDLVHLHLARDLVTMPAGIIARLLGIPYIVQPHGMIDAPTRLSARILDRIATRGVIRNARAVLGLTDMEEHDLQRVGGRRLPFKTIGNGIPDEAISRHVLSSPTGPVIFVGRLHARKRPLLFMQAAQRAIAYGVSNPFAVYGPDEGELSSLTRFLDDTGLGSKVRLVGSLPRNALLAEVAQASLMVVTTDRERFGMAMIEAMAQGVPIVCTDSGDLAPVIDRERAGLVCDDDPEQIARHIVSLTNNPELWTQMSKNARELVRNRYTLSTVLEGIESSYATAVRER